MTQVHGVVGFLGHVEHHVQRVLGLVAIVLATSKQVFEQKLVFGDALNGLDQIRVQ